ncbi:hypothetical protein JCM11251_007256 [Rhodosporidiobolus azoricus]
MVRRILEDSYKPLRVKDYKKPIPQPSPLPSQLFTSPPSSTTEAEAPPRPLHPWEVEFKAPDHYNPAPGYRARIPLRSGPAATSAAAKARQAAQRAGGARKARLASAYEASLDYRGGVRPSEIKAERDKEGEEHANDAGMLGPMSGWSGIVENRILQAKREGLFRNIRGRGKPLPKDDAESNPFISRSEFLINRIMKEQDTAPPWVEMQKELELALSTWRTNLRASWSRRAIRIRSSEGLTPAVIREVKEGWMDPEWEARERAYHDAALHDVNQLVRKYNVIAPYHVRRPLLTLRSELDTAISGSASHIAAELQRRLDLGLNTTPAKVIYQDEGGEDGVKSVTAEEMGGERKAVKESMWQGFRRLVVEVLAQPPDPVGQAARPGSGSGR